MKKTLKKIAIILGIIIIIALMLFAVDYNRVKSNKRPIFCIKNPAGTLKDGGTVEFIGLGYKVIDFNTIAGFNNIKIGTWFMDYNDFYEEIREHELRFEEQLIKDNMSMTKEAIVVKVNTNNLLIIGKEDTTNLYSLGFTDEGNIGFKQGQEILIYFNGTIMESYPAQFGNVEEIKIIKENSEIEIPDQILRYCYSSYDKVNIEISEIINNGITLTITDTNKKPYNYAHNYIINKKMKNSSYTGVGEKIGEDTQNSTSGFTGVGLEYIWQELNKISNIQSEDTEEILTSVKEENYSVEKRKYDWNELYGTLNERRI